MTGQILTHVRARSGPGEDRGLAKTMDFFHTFVMPGHWYTELFEVAADQNGFVTTDDMRELGGTTQVLIDMHRHGQLQRVAHGLYRFALFPPNPRDEMKQATLWPRGLGVISHDSALDLWELCDVNPAKIHVTVPRSARIRRQKPALYVVHLRDLDPIDVTGFEGIPVVTPRRAILDGIERHLDNRLIEQAVDIGHRRGLLLAEEVTDLERV
jgi:predicted transcriptional regulator of viral defense system